jgi:hypothetical protein
LPEDGPWLIDAWFSGDGRLFEGLSGRLGPMPDGPLRDRIKAEIAGDAESKLAVLHLAAWHATLTDRVEIFRRLSSDPDPTVRNYAKMILPRPIPGEELSAASRPKASRPPRTGRPPGRR